MSTTLLNCEIALSKELGDYWAGTSTSSGSSTTIVDTALKAKANDWITDEAYDMITSGTYDEEERKISNLDNTTGTLTALAHGGTIASSVTYRVHRLFEASEKRRALVSAAKSVYPTLFKEIWDESLVSGNWLKDGSFERWTSSSALTDWAITTVTAAQTTSSPYYRHGATSCKLSGSAGTVAQSITNFDDLKNLRGRTVTFTIQAHCDTADSLRISVNDGTTQTYSSYHTGDTAWTEDNPRNDNMYVTQYIDANATEVTFTIHHGASTVSYIDDARVISDYRGRLYIGHLGLALNRPHQVFIEPSYYSQQEDWIRVFDTKVDKDGYIYIPTTYPSDYRLRIRGIGYLDFLDSSRVVGTDWDDTISVDDPQLKILVAQAVLYLYTWMAMPNYESGTREDYQQMVAYWKQELAERKAQFGMVAPGATVSWGIN